MHRESEELTGHRPHVPASRWDAVGEGKNHARGSFLLIALGMPPLASLTWTCSSVKMGCSSIGGMGVLVVTDASRICLKTCRRVGQKAAGDCSTLVSCYSAGLLHDGTGSLTPPQPHISWLGVEAWFSTRWTSSNPAFPPSLDDSCV